MDWATFQAARTYLSEHRVGVRIRKTEAIEDDEFAEAAKQLTGRRT